MTTLKDKIIESGLANHVLTDIDLNNLLLRSTPAARYGMVNKSLKKTELIKIRRGLYLLADKYRQKKLSKFFLASRIVPHSYISLESALAYHGWIPEHVRTTMSVLAHGRTKEFVTPFQEFVFYQLPVNEYEFLTGVTRIEDIKDEPFFLASPLRALADYVYLKKIEWEGLRYLTHSLRIEMEQLMQIDSDCFLEIKKVYHSKRVLCFLDNLKKELNK
jgi:predicted transcriptional regulator of viral defense system